jgi:hypothetical protein
MENNNLILLACGLVGVFVHCLFKAKDLIDYAKKANIDFGAKDYIQKDWFAISLSLATIAIWFLIFGEVGAKYPKIIDFIRCSFVLMGWFGSYIAQKMFSRGKSYISDIIDKKTNIADALKFAADDDGPGGSNPPPDKDDK